MGSGQVGQAEVLNAKLSGSVGKVGLAGQIERRHRVLEAAGWGESGVAVEAAAGAAAWGGDFFGMIREPFCPQAVKVTALAARTRALTRIRRVFNMDKL